MRRNSKFLKDLFAITGFIVTHPLNVEHKLRALGNFLRWQIAARLLRLKVVVPWVADAKIISGLSETGLTGNIYVGFTEYRDMLFLLHALRPTDTFVDVGANVGAYTVLASKVVGSRSIAFEPLPDTVDRLKDQIQINRIGSLVEIRNVGIGDVPGELHFTRDFDTTNRVAIAGEGSNTTAARISTLDVELIRDERYLIKVDVEGYEYQVLTGGIELLEMGGVFAIIVELNGSGEAFGHNNEEIHQKLVSLQFTPVSYDPMRRELHRLNSYNTDSANTIYVKDIEAVRALCRSAPRRVVHTANKMQL